MATATLISYGDWTVPADEIDARIPWGSIRDAWRHQIPTRTRAGQAPALAPGSIGERRTVVEFSPAAGSLTTLNDLPNILFQGLDPTDLTPKLLVLTDPDGIEMQRLAVIEVPYGAPEDQAREAIRTTFVSADPVWRQTDTDVFGPYSAAYSGGSPISPTITVAGYAPTKPLVTLTPTTLDPASNLYQAKRSFTVTNNGTKTWRKHPIMVDLFNTSTGWGYLPGGAMVEANTALFLNGKPQRRQIVGAGLAQTYLWIVVDHLAPGKSLTYDIVYDAPGDVLTLSGKNRPVFDLSWWNGTATAGSSTTMTDSGRTWETNQWQRATLRILTGPGAGEEHLISSNTGTVITINDTFTVTPTSSSTYLIYHSSNTKWTYAVRQTERTGEHTGQDGNGLYWTNKTQSKPDAFSFDAPGSWSPYSFLSNRDDRNQETEGTPVNVGTLDYFAILDADRSWQGDSLKNSGFADGLMFSSPREITQWRFDGLFKNPNGIAKGFYGSRSAGSLGWTSVREETTAADALTHFGTTTFVLDDETYQLVMALLPADEVEIPLSKRKDSGTATTGDNGTATGGTTTTLTDTTKSWTTNQWVGYRVLITAGTAVGQDRAITANTGTQLTFAAGTAPDTTSQYVILSRTLLQDATKEWTTNQWVNARVRITAGRGEGAQATVTANTSTELTANFGVNVDATSRYEVTNKHLVATLRTDLFFYVLLDDSTIGISGPTAQEITAQVGVTVRAGGGLSPTAPYKRMRTGVGRKIFVEVGAEELRIDCEHRRAAIYFINAAFVHDVTDSVVVEDVDADGNATLATDWMQLSPGNTTFYVDNPTNATVEMTVEIAPGFFA